MLLWNYLKRLVYYWVFVALFFILDGIGAIGYFLGVSLSADWKLTILALSFGIASFLIFREQALKIDELNQKLEHEPLLPDLVVRLFYPEEHPTEYLSSLNYVIPEHYDFRPSFGLAIVNRTEASIATNLNLSIEVFWNGNEPTRAIGFRCPGDNPLWETSHGIITNGAPARLEFRGTDVERVPHGHPLAWRDFSFHVRDNLKGSMTIRYELTSASPPTSSAGELSIVLG